MFAREGYPFILGAAALAAIAFAMALRLRSWPLWLVALLLTVIALCVAWSFRNPTRIGERGANVTIAPANGSMGLIRFDARVNLFLPPDTKLRVALGKRSLAGEMLIADLSVT